MNRTKTLADLSAAREHVREARRLLNATGVSDLLYDIAVRPILSDLDVAQSDISLIVDRVKAEK